tara:strand:- start:722 stop:1717 length:996 start_codon:yes stop_codon:yes gene_type:complete
MTEKIKKYFTGGHEDGREFIISEYAKVFQRGRREGVVPRARIGVGGVVVEELTFERMSDIFGQVENGLFNTLQTRVCASEFEEKNHPIISRMPMFEHRHPREKENWWHFWRNCSTEELMIQLRKQISFMVNVAGPLVDEGRTFLMMKDMMNGVHPFRGFDNGFNGAHPDTSKGSEWSHMFVQAKVYYRWFCNDWVSGTFDILATKSFTDELIEEWNGNRYYAISTEVHFSKFYIPRGGLPINTLKMKPWVSNILPMYQEPIPEYEEPVPIYDADSPPDYDSDDGFVTADEGWWDGKDEEDEDDYNPEDFCINCPKPIALNSEYCSYCLNAL